MYYFREKNPDVIELFFQQERTDTPVPPFPLPPKKIKYFQFVSFEDAAEVRLWVVSKRGAGRVLL
jgi:hypothetical protein